MDFTNATSAISPLVCHLGAQPSDWAAWQALGLMADLLPVVSDQTAAISPNSKMTTLGKTPSTFNRDGHAVGVPGWTSAQSTGAHVAQWAKDGRLGICVQTRNVRAIDIDISDPAIARQIADLIEMDVGKMPMRKRSNSGKCLLVFKMSGDFAKRVIKTPDGIIEFLATGQQFIAVGTHTSGVRYEWPGGLPTSIPTLTEAGFEGLWAGLASVYGIEGGSTTQRTGAAPTQPRMASDVSDHRHAWLIENEWATGYERDGRLHVRCPWEDGHSVDSGPSSTTYFPAGVGGFEKGHFKCLHSSCAKHTDGHFDAATGYTAIDFEVIDLDAGDQAEGDAAAVRNTNAASAASCTRQDFLDEIEHGGVLGYAPHEVRAMVVAKLSAAGLSAPDEEDVLRATKDATGAGLGALRKELQRARSASEADPGGAVGARAPVATAKALIKAKFTADGECTILRWNGSTYVWNGRCYAETSDEDIRAKVYHLFTERRITLESKSPVDNTVDALRALVNVPANMAVPGWLASADGADRPEALELTAVANGLLDVRTRALVPHTPSFFNTSVVGVEFDPNAPTPVAWLKFMEDAFPADPESQAAVRQWMGYFLTSDTRYQKALICVGPKRSGKGTFARVVRGLVGETAYAGPSLRDLGGQFGLQGLIDKQVAVISDARLSGQADQQAISENILRMTGEDVVTVQRKNMADLNVKLRARLVLMTNVLPGIVDGGGALASRFIVIRFGQSFFGREDPLLTDKLIEELPGILLWALGGLDDLYARRAFIQPTAGLAAVNELRRKTTPITGFIEDVLDTSSTDCWVAKDSLYQLYKEWCEVEGNKFVNQKQSFFTELYSNCDVAEAIRPRCPNFGDRVNAVRGFAVNYEHAKNRNEFLPGLVQGKGN